MHYWLIMLVAFAMFAVACEDKSGTELVETEDVEKAKEVPKADDSDAGATEKTEPAKEEPKIDEKAKTK